MTGALPNTIEALDSEWLTGALRRSGTISGDASVQIAEKAPLTAGTAFATHMYRLRLDGPDGCPETAILKLPVTGEIREFIDGVGAYAREVTFYRELAADVPLRVPTPYVAEMSTETTDFVLLLEDLSDLDPVDQITGLPLEQAGAALDDLARFHAWSWGDERLDRLAGSFPPLDGPVGRGASEMFVKFYSAAWPGARQALGNGIAPDIAELGERLPSLLPQLIDRLGSPRTITHGELRADNLFISPDGQLTMIDFQTVGQQAGMIDVSYLLSQSLATSVRRENEESLVRRYWQGLGAAGVSGYGWDDAWMQYRVGIAYNLLWAVMAHGQSARIDDRGRQLVTKMLERACTAMADNDSPGAVDS